MTAGRPVPVRHGRIRRYPARLRRSICGTGLVARAVFAVFDAQREEQNAKHDETPAHRVAIDGGIPLVSVPPRRMASKTRNATTVFVVSNSIRRTVGVHRLIVWGCRRGAAPSATAPRLSTLGGVERVTESRVLLKAFVADRTPVIDTMRVSSRSPYSVLKVLKRLRYVQTIDVPWLPWMHADPDRQF